jgi:hypothetical protein
VGGAAALIWRKTPAIGSGSGGLKTGSSGLITRLDKRFRQAMKRAAMELA